MIPFWGGLRSRQFPEPDGVADLGPRDEDDLLRIPLSPLSGRGRVTLRLPLQLSPSCGEDMQGGYG